MYSSLRFKLHITLVSKRRGHPLSDARYNDVIRNAMVSQITGVSIVCSTVGSGADQRKRQSSASLAFVRGINWWPANSPHKRPVTREMFPFDDVLMRCTVLSVPRQGMVILITERNIEKVVAVATLNTLRPRQNWRHFADDIFKCIVVSENW